MSDVNSYYNELLKRAGASPDQYSNATNNIENIGNTIYSQSQLTDNDYEKYLPQAEESVNDDLSSSLISPSEDPSWYGVPGDWLPDWVKQGYNNSIEGLAIHLATGKPHFDIGTYAEDEKDYPILEDIGSTVMSFMTITDMGTIIGGGGLAGGIANVGYKKAAQESIKQLIKRGVVRGLGKEGAEKAAKETVEKLVKENSFKASQVLMRNGINKELAEKAVTEGAKKLPSKIMSATIGGGGGLGFYSGLQSAMGQKVKTGDINATLVLKDTAIGTGLGAVTAGTGAGFNKYLVSKLGAPVTKTQKLAYGTAVKALETAEFGTATPLLEGRMPELKDYAHAAGVIGSLNVAKRIPTKIAQLAGYDNPMISMKESGASLLAKITQGKLGKTDIWQSKKGGMLTDVKFEDVIKNGEKVGVQVRGKRVDKGGTISEKETVLTEEQFTKMGFARRGATSPKSLESARRAEIFNRKKNLNISDKNFRRMIEAETGKDINPKKHKTGYSQLGDIQKIRLLDRLRKQELSKQILDKYKAEGYDDFFVARRGISTMADKYAEFLMQAKNRYKTKIGLDFLKEVNAADARGITLSGSDIQALKEAGLYSGGIVGRMFGRIKVEVPSENYKVRGKSPYKGRDGKYYIKLRREKDAKEYFEDLGRRMGREEYESDADVTKMRDILTRIYFRAKEAGIPVAEFRKHYFPNQIKDQYLKHLGSDIFRLIEADPAFSSTKMQDKVHIREHMSKLYKEKKGSFSDETMEALEYIAKQLIKEAGDAGKTLSMDEAFANAFIKIRDTVYQQRYSIVGNLEKQRKANFPEHFYERDARLVLTKYVNDIGKRQAMTEFFGAKNEKIELKVAQLQALAESARAKGNKKAEAALYKEIKWLQQTFDSFSNMIEVDPTKNWGDPRARKFVSDLVDFEVATKIGLGYATIPNITQTLISTAVKAGYWNTFKGGYRLLTDKEYRKQISASGLSNLSVFQMVSGLEPSDAFFGRWAHRLTKASGFQAMNKYNQYLAAAAGREHIKNLVDVINGRGKGISKLKSKSWAKEKLVELGLPENVKQLTDRQMSESMYRFARDAQLQRNVLNDPLFFNDPRFRPLILFKRFGYKQFNWVREQVFKDVFKHGNVLPLLRLGVGGFFGAEFVVWSKKALNNFLAGEEVYDENQLFIPGLPPGTPLGTGGSDINTDMSKYTYSDFLDQVAAVGAMGFIGDILSNEDKFRAVEFFLNPAILQDAGKIYDALQRISSDVGDYGIGISTGQRSIKYIAPILGTAPRRLAQQVETEGQKESYIKYRRGIVKGRILDALIDGNSEEAHKIRRAWNRAYHKEAIYYDEYGISAIYDRKQKKREKRRKP